MYSTPVLEVARHFGARDITESKLLNYDVICGCAGRLSGPVLVVKRETDGACVVENCKSEGCGVGDMCGSLVVLAG
jgi:hypothetical protein